MSISDIVKSGAMYGANAPSYKVTIEGLGGEVSEISTTKVAQGYNGVTEFTMTRWIPAASGGYISCYFNSSNQLVTGFCSDTSFLTTNHAIESITVQSGITCVGRNQRMMDIHRKQDGKLLLFAADWAISSPYKSWLDMYQSESGDGGDWAFVSRVHESAVRTNTLAQGLRNVRILYIGQRLHVFWIGFNIYNSDYLGSEGFHIYSDDEGATWGELTAFKGAGGATYRPLQMGQPTALPDGTIYVSMRNSQSSETSRKSTTSGVTWVTGPGFDENFDGISGYGPNLNFSYYYHAHSGNCYIFLGGAKSSSPVPAGLFLNSTGNFEDTNAWQRVGIDLSQITTGGGMIYEVAGHVVIQANSNDGVLWTNYFENISGEIPSKNITVSQSLGQAGSATVEIDNKDGAYSYDGILNSQKIGPNKQIGIDLGYGSEQERVFYGLIDKTTASSFPQSLTVDARDYSKLALDGTVIRPTDGFRTFSFVDQKPEQIFSTLAGWAGYSSINVDTTDITIPLKTCNWETYADVFGWLCDITGYDWWVDNQGAIFFRQRASNEPRATDEALSLALVGSDYTATVANTPVFDGSVVVTDSTGTTTYTEDEDYSIDLSTGVITALAGGLLASGGDILVSYTYPRHVFKEGEDILSISYTIDDADLYYKVVAYGQDASGNGIKGEWTISSAIFGVQTNKLLKIDIDGVSTTAQLESIATKVGLACRLRARSVSVTAIGVPTVQVGDCVQIIESSSGISEIYRVTDLAYQFAGQFTMSFTAYYVGYAPVGGEPVE